MHVFAYREVVLMAAFTAEFSPHHPSLYPLLSVQVESLRFGMCFTLLYRSAEDVARGPCG